MKYSMTGRGVLLLMTGAGAVAYELAAIRAFTGLFGGTVRSAAVIVAVFLGALALGALWFGRLADASRRPVRLFGGVALSGGVLMLITPHLIDLCDQLAVRAVFEEGWSRWGSMTLGASGVVGLPALFLGGGLPALVSVSRNAAELRREPGMLYGINTLGSVLGAWVAGFWLLESLGIRSTLRIAGGLVLLAGLAGLFLGRRSVFEGRASTAVKTRSKSRGVRGLLVSAFCAGFAVLALEVLGTRLLMQFMQSSAHSFALVLIVFLSGISLGAACGAKYSQANRTGVAGLVFGLMALGVLVAATGPLVVWAGELAGQGSLRSVFQQFALASLLFPATFASGAVFAMQAAFPGQSARPASHFGRLTFVNTLGGIAGSLLAGFVCLPGWGLKLSLLLAAAVAVLGAFSVANSRGTLALAAAGLLPVAGLFLPFELRPLPDHPLYRQLVSYQEGPVANVVVLESPMQERPVLFINRTTLQGGGPGSLLLERKQGLLPGALHPNPQKALVLGVGTGATISGLLDAGVRSVQAVELVDSVVDVLPLFEKGTGNLLLRPEVEFFREDAVAFVRAVRSSYDLIVGDLFFPWLDGTGALYSVEHFRAVRERLAPGGLFCQWVPLYQMKWADFGLLARTFRSVFDTQTWILLEEPSAAQPVVALIGSVEMLRFDPIRLDRLLQESRFAPAYQAVNLSGSGDLLELYFGDQYVIDAVFGGARALGEADLLNTRDQPVLEYRAARTPETEDVLALANLNNLALQLGGSLSIYLDLKDGMAEERRAQFERNCDVRAAALVQYLFGRYCFLRAQQPDQDRLLLERKEAEYYLTGLIYAREHKALNRAAAELSYRMLNDRRHADVIGYVTRLLEVQPENQRALGNLALAYLALGQEQAAADLLVPSLAREETDVLNMMLLGVASYLLGDDQQSRLALRRAFAAAPNELPSLAQAIGVALEGDPFTAARMAASLTEDRVWGILAKRAILRFQQASTESLPQAPASGGG